MPVMNVELPDAMHRRLAATAAACGVTMKEAVVAATRSWVDQHAAEAAEALGLGDPQAPAPGSMLRRRGPASTPAESRPGPADASQRADDLRTSTMTIDEVLEIERAKIVPPRKDEA